MPAWKRARFISSQGVVDPARISRPSLARHTDTGRQRARTEQKRRRWQSRFVEKAVCPREGKTWEGARPRKALSHGAPGREATDGCTMEQTHIQYTHPRTRADTPAHSLRPRSALPSRLEQDDPNGTRMRHRLRERAQPGNAMQPSERRGSREGMPAGRPPCCSSASRAAQCRAGQRRAPGAKAAGWRGSTTQGGCAAGDAAQAFPSRGPVAQDSAGRFACPTWLRREGWSRPGGSSTP